MTDETNPLVEKIKALDLKSGDIVLVRYPGSLSERACGNIRESLSRELDVNANKILILEEGMDIKLIRTETLKAELEAQEE